MCRSGKVRREILPLIGFSVRKIETALREVPPAAGFNSKGMENKAEKHTFAEIKVQ